MNKSSLHFIHLVTQFEFSLISILLTFTQYAEHGNPVYYYYFNQVCLDIADLLAMFQLHWSCSLSGNLSISAQMRVPLYKEAQNLCFMLLKANYVIMEGHMIVIYFSEPAPTPGESGWESCTVTRSTTFSEIHSTRAEDSRRFES